MTGWGIPAVCAAACLAFAATGRVAAAEAPASSGLIITRQALHAERLAAGEATRGPLATAVATQSQDRLLTLSGGRVDLAISRHRHRPPPGSPCTPHADRRGRGRCRAAARTRADGPMGAERGVADPS